jgi:Transglycosylase SLT domain
MVANIQFNAAQGSVRQAIFNAASATGIDFAYLMNQARVESGFDPGAQAKTSSATGLYQFIEQSWLGTVARHGEAHGLGWAALAISQGRDGRYRIADPSMRQAVLNLRRDPQAAASMAAEFAGDNKAYLEARLGREAEPVDLYLAHFLGATGAAKFLKARDENPAASAADLFPAAARSNRNVFFEKDGSARSLDAVRQRFAVKFGSAPSPQTDPVVHAPQWTMQSSQREPLAAVESKAQARLAYLMLASLGVSA